MQSVPLPVSHAYLAFSAGLLANSPARNAALPCSLMFEYMTSSIRKCSRRNGESAYA